MIDINLFLDNQRQMHLNNGQQIYYSECYRQHGPGRRASIMPATPFIFEFFIYNSLYHYDWQKSFSEQRLISHDEQIPDQDQGLSESAKQSRLERFIRDKCRNKPEILRQAFLPLMSLSGLDESWTEVRSGVRITSADGEGFFKHLRAIKELVISNQPLTPSRALFDEINKCRFFVSNVRNNIFHGSKALGTLGRNQSRRVEVYHLFIQCLVSLFFLACDYPSAACDEVCLPIEVKSRSGEGLKLEAKDVLGLVVKGVMKPEDCHLIPWAHEQLATIRSRQAPEGALFYPSAGDDVITPILLGLPYCKEFYFYDATRKRDGLRQLSKLMGLRLPVDWQRAEPVDFTFEFDGHTRRVCFTRGDNLDFLKTGNPLTFFFRRGDSEEGGSSHRWENDLFEKWRVMIPAGRSCGVLTDGIPGGLNRQLQDHMSPPYKFPNSERGRDYYCGVIRG